jgi:hypothetical protein
LRITIGWNFDGLNRIGKGKATSPDQVKKNLYVNKQKKKKNKARADFNNNIWDQSLSRLLILSLILR